MGKYPECERIAETRKGSQLIGEFVTWLSDEKKIHLCLWDKIDDVDELFRITTSTEKLLADFFGIDLDKAEEERRMMIYDIRDKEVK